MFVTGGNKLEVDGNLLVKVSLDFKEASDASGRGCSSSNSHEEPEIKDQFVVLCKEYGDNFEKMLSRRSAGRR